MWIDLCGRALPARNMKDGIRAVVNDKPITPEEVQRYLDARFGEHLQPATQALGYLAKAYAPQDLAGAAFSLYERFRPEITSGTAGWGRKGCLDLDLIRSLAKR